MVTTATLMKEIESLPEKAVAEVFAFIVFLKNKPFGGSASGRMSTRDARGIFRDLKGMDTTIEREEDERV
jgi:hypothetical protein